MEEVYDLQQHKYCVIFYISEHEAYIQIRDFSKKKYDEQINVLREKATITYNEEGTKVVTWGNTSIENMAGKNHKQFHGFMNKLYQLFKKKHEDKFLIKAVADFLYLATKQLMKHPEIEDNSLDCLHYAFVVPSEWEEEIREELLRPMFIQAKLISKSDHKTRLIFISDIENICYNRDRCLIKRGQNTIMFRVTPTGSNTALIKLDLIKASNNLFDLPDSMLFPKVIASRSFSITSDEIKNCILTFLKLKKFPRSEITDHEKIIGEAIYNSIDSWKVFKSKEDWPSYISKLFVNNDDEGDENILTKLALKDTTQLKLSSPQATFLKNVSLFDLCDILCIDIVKMTNLILSYQFIKKYEVLVVYDWHSSEIDLDLSMEIWLRCMLEYNKQTLNKLTTLNVNDSNFCSIDLNGIISGTQKLAKETIQNSNIYCPPRISPLETLTQSTSIFLNDRPDAIFNIDISFRSTLLSFTVLNDDGLAKKVTIDHSDFTVDNYLPSLDLFYGISDAVALTVNKKFISCVDKCLTDEDILVYKYFVYNKYGATIKEELISTTQHKYIREFFLAYLIYINSVISDKLLKYTESKNTIMKIGYAISIEKFVMDNIVCDRKTLEKQIQKSGILEKNNTHSKLRIITQGEGILSIIQQSFNLDFPIKSYFVYTQIQEDYLQFNLNQVVTNSLDNKQGEAIIIQSEIYPIQNVYDSLCLNMWNHIMENDSLVKLCASHNKPCSELKLGLLTWKKREYFMNNFKRCISENILASDAELRDFGKKSIRLHDNCACTVSLIFSEIIEFSFGPFLKDISRTILSSLINKNLFGEYANIKYNFSIFHFNQNKQFQNIITAMMKEESEDFNPERGIETSCVTMPSFTKPFSELLLPYFYKGFIVGSLHQVYDKNYVVELSIMDLEQKPKGPYELLKEGDIRTSGTEINKSFDILAPNTSVYDIMIVIYERRKDTLKAILDFCFEFYNEYSSYKIPFVVTVKSLGYSSSIQFSARVAGQDIESEFQIAEIGEPMTLRRL